MNKTMQVIKKLTGIAVLMAAMIVVAACSHTETYQEKRDKEISAINSFIAEKNVKVISEETFFAQDSVTDVSKNEFVLFEASGVYMQIVRKGCGEKLKNGETATVLCRFTEYNLKLGADSVTLSNEFLISSSLNPSYAVNPERMTITNTSGTYSGYFDTSSYMYLAYGMSQNSTSVLSGWLVPFARPTCQRWRRGGEGKAHRPSQGRPSHGGQQRDALSLRHHLRTWKVNYN